MVISWAAFGKKVIHQFRTAHSSIQVEETESRRHECDKNDFENRVGLEPGAVPHISTPSVVQLGKVGSV